MTRNEKLILTLLSSHGPLTKKALASKGNLGWSTVVKMVTRLEGAGWLKSVGTEIKTGTGGKSAALYDLAERSPLALGVDVEYTKTSVILTNLKNIVLEQRLWRTPVRPDRDELKEFLVRVIRESLEEMLGAKEHVSGVGVGLPLWLSRDPNGILSYLSGELEKELSTRIRIENNVRCYSMYKKWLGRASGYRDFILITIRHGVGVGIFIGNRLYRGYHGLAGELSHVRIDHSQRRCRCGKIGCLETLVNKDALYRQYLTQVRHMELDSYEFDDAESKRGLEDLFRKAQAMDREALDIVQRTAGYLAEGIATLLLILDIPHVIISAEFGESGEILVPHVKERLNGCLLPGMEYTLSYYPLEVLGFAHGSAMLILNDYYTSPEESTGGETG
jgi:predicted NBD/HSP70 family sugar kinase